MSEPVLSVLNPDEIDAHTQSLKPFLASVCSYSRGRYSVDTVLDLARKGLWQIWVIHDLDRLVFVGGTTITVYETGLKTLEIRFGTGHGRRSWENRIGDVLAWGRNAGCVIAEGNFRKGWRRVLPGWIHSHEHMERLL